MNLKLNILLDYYFFKIFLCDGVPAAGSVLKLLFVFNDMKSLLQVAVYDDKSWWWFTSSNILYDTVLSDIFYFSNQICNMTTFKGTCVFYLVDWNIVKPFHNEKLVFLPEKQILKSTYLNKV